MPASHWPDRIDAPAAWQRVDFASDVHLHAQDRATADAWLQYLTGAAFDALFILGDLFEVWVGDDVLDADPTQDPEIAFLGEMAAALQRLTQQRPVFLLHGNRDFLLGTGFAERTGVQLLQDPAVLAWGKRRYLLSHGDAWCVADQDYQRFRAQVRDPAWQRRFLSLPLAERRAQARALRARSSAQQAARRAAGLAWADVDSDCARQALAAAQAQTLIHGHTHHPAVHPLPAGGQRIVLSDWDASARPPRLQVLRLYRDGHWCLAHAGAPSG
jgi:UDP-2,3-diacylglucosamine hydrolase